MKNDRDQLLLSLVGFLHWLFGNLYEVIVFSPNLLLSDNQVATLTSIRNLFQVSAPYYYYLPWSPLSVGLTVYLWFRLRRVDAPAVKRWINAAAMSALSAGLLTWYIIVTFNLTLYVGSATYREAELNRMLWLNVLVGNCRLLAVGLTAYFLFKAYQTLLVTDPKVV